MDRCRLRVRVVACLLGSVVMLAGCSDDPDEEENDAANREHVAQLFASGFEGGDEVPGESASIPADAMLAYRADPGIRREVAGMLADNLNRNFSLRFRIDDPEQFLRSGAAADVGNRMVEALGLPSDTVAGATVLMFGLSWELANGEALTPDDQKALLNQAAKMLGDHDVSGRGDAARQREGDARLLTAALWLEEARLRRGDAQAMSDLSDAVARDMKVMTGNDMRAHRITAEGFVDR